MDKNDIYCDIYFDVSRKVHYLSEFCGERIEEGISWEELKKELQKEFKCIQKDFTFRILWEPEKLPPDRLCLPFSRMKTHPLFNKWWLNWLNNVEKNAKRIFNRGDTD